MTATLDTPIDNNELKYDSSDKSDFAKGTFKAQNSLESFLHTPQEFKLKGDILEPNSPEKNPMDNIENVNLQINKDFDSSIEALRSNKKGTAKFSVIETAACMPIEHLEVKGYQLADTVENSRAVGDDIDNTTGGECSENSVESEYPHKPLCEKSCKVDHMISSGSNDQLLRPTIQPLSDRTTRLQPTQQLDYENCENDGIFNFPKLNKLLNLRSGFPSDNKLIPSLEGNDDATYGYTQRNDLILNPIIEFSSKNNISYPKKNENEQITFTPGNPGLQQFQELRQRSTHSYENTLYDQIATLSGTYQLSRVPGTQFAPKLPKFLPPKTKPKHELAACGKMLSIENNTCKYHRDRNMFVNSFSDIKNTLKLYSSNTCADAKLIDSLTNYEVPATVYNTLQGILSTKQSPFLKLDLTGDADGFKNSNGSRIICNNHLRPDFKTGEKTKFSNRQTRLASDSLESPANSLISGETKRNTNSASNRQTFQVSGLSPTKEEKLTDIMQQRCYGKHQNTTQTFDNEYSEMQNIELDSIHSTRYKSEVDDGYHWAALSSKFSRPMQPKTPHTSCFSFPSQGASTKALFNTNCCTSREEMPKINPSKQFNLHSVFTTPSQLDSNPSDSDNDLQSMDYAPTISELSPSDAEFPAEGSIYRSLLTSNLRKTVLVQPHSDY